MFNDLLFMCPECLKEKRHQWHRLCRGCFALEEFQNEVREKALPPLIEAEQNKLASLLVDILVDQAWEKNRWFL